MRMIERFDLYMRYKRLNDNQVSTQLGLSNGVIGKSRKPGRDISHRVLEQIEKFYTDLNIEWVKTGEGQMLKPAQEENHETIRDGHFISAENMKINLNQCETIRSQQETIRLLTEMVNRLTGGATELKKDNVG